MAAADRFEPSLARTAPRRPLPQVCFKKTNAVPYRSCDDVTCNGGSERPPPSQPPLLPLLVNGHGRARALLRTRLVLAADVPPSPPACRGGVCHFLRVLQELVHLRHRGPQVLHWCAPHPLARPPLGAARHRPFVCAAAAERLNG